jgi:hypothetical protein
MWVISFSSPFWGYWFDNMIYYNFVYWHGKVEIKSPAQLRGAEWTGFVGISLQILQRRLPS